MAQIIRSGHLDQLGVDTRKSPQTLNPKFSAGAVNRTFRGGNNSTRPPIRSLELLFDTTENKEVFERGSVQAVAAYQKQTRGTLAHIIVCVHDRILKGRIAGNVIYFSTLFKGTNPEIMGAALMQGSDRIYWQDGVHRPVGWDGNAKSYVIPDGPDSMPLAVSMAYVRGRALMITADGYVIISDHIYGNGIRDTSGLESFVEYQYVNDLGAIAPVGKFGQVVGAIEIPMLPTINKNLSVLVMQEAGAYTLDLSGPRADWINNEVQRPFLDHTGSSSGQSLLKTHSDIFFCSTRGGIESLKWNQRRVDNDWSELSVSAEVQKYMKFTAPKDQRWTSSIFHNNRIIFTCGITVEHNPFGGAHHFGQGMVVLDVERGSTVNETSGFQWEGMWTGPNVVGFANILVDGAHRALMVSHDDDGKNRIYESVEAHGDDSYDGHKRKIVSFYDTPILFAPRSIDELAGGFPVFTLNGAKMRISDIYDEVSASVSYRPAFHENWTEIMSNSRTGCPEITDDISSTENISGIGSIYGSFTTSTPGNSCDESTGKVLRKSIGFQFRVTLEGFASVPFFLAEVSAEAESSNASCNTESRCAYMKVGDNDPLFQYKIVPKPSK